MSDALRDIYLLQTENILSVCRKEKTRTHIQTDAGSLHLVCYTFGYCLPYSNKPSSSIF